MTKSTIHPAQTPSTVAILRSQPVGMSMNTGILETPHRSINVRLATVDSTPRDDARRSSRLPESDRAVQPPVTEPGDSKPYELEMLLRNHFESHPHFRGRSCWLEFDTTNDREVTLRGILPSFYLKQLAQELSRQFSGDRRIRNQIMVVNPRGRSR